MGDGPQPPRAAADRTVHMIGHAHLDLAWLWPWQEAYAEARATFWSAIHLMDQYPDFVFTMDQVVLLAWVEEQDPDLFARIRERVAQGRWHITGGWWVEPDCNLPSGESLVRQGLHGQRYLMTRFGIRASIGMNADPFGHNAMLPQIVRGQGMDAYLFLRPAPHEAQLPGTAFWWQSPDGSRVLAYRIPFEYWSHGGEVSNQVAKSLAQVDRDMRDVMVFFGVGNHGGGPTRANIESIHTYDRMGTYGRLRISDPRRFVDALLAGAQAPDSPAPGADLATWSGDLQHHAPGCYSAHSGIKTWVQRAEHALLAAERWAIVARAGADDDYPRDALAHAWRQVLLNQFHDILPGSAIESAYDDARDQLGEATAIAKRVIARAHGRIARRVNIPLEPDTQPVLVFNPHPWPVRHAVDINYPARPEGIHVVDGDGVEVACQRTTPTSTTEGDATRHAVTFDTRLPPLGYRLYRLRPGPPPVSSGKPEPTGLAATTRSLENDTIRVDIDPATGWLSSLTDKRTGVDLVAPDARHTQICPDPTDTWGHNVVSYALPGESMVLRSLGLREYGPVRAVLRAVRTWRQSTLVEDIVLDRDADMIEVRVTLDWREPLHLLKLRLATTVRDATATFDMPFGTIVRPVNGAEEPAQSWVDVSGRCPGSPDVAGLALVVAHKHGFDVSPQDESGPSIGVTVARSPAYAWHYPAELDPDESYSYQDIGRQRFRYLLVPHAHDWRTAQLARRSAELLSPPRAALESAHPGTLPARHSLLSAEGCDNVLVTAVKGSEDEAEPDLIVRAVETLGRPGRLRLRTASPDRSEIVADLGPHQILTLRIPADAGQPVTRVDLVELPIAPVAPEVTG